MPISAPLFASEHNAAKLLDLKPGEFRALVEGGHLPKPRKIGGHDRWDTEEIRRIVTGETALTGGMDW